MAVSELDDVHLVQVRNYLQVFGLEVGLLLNFGRRSVEFNRRVARHGAIHISAGQDERDGRLDAALVEPYERVAHRLLILVNRSKEC